MILITGSGGKTGRAVSAALSREGHKLRLFRRQRGDSASVEGSGGEIYVGDLERPEEVAQACAGVEAVYHIGPNMHPRERQIGLTAIEAAKQEGVQHFVYHSVLFPQVKAMPHHWRKLEVEQALIESGLAFTILQPAAYYQNFGNRWSEILQESTYRVPYPLETRLSLVDLMDVAEAAATVMLESEHAYAMYPLVGPESPNQRQVAEAMSDVSGRRIKPVEIEPEAWAREARDSGMEGHRVGDFVSMFRYYADHEFLGNPWVLKKLLGRDPVGLDEYLGALAAEHKGR
ncbi:MAG: NmrA family NAD(P)-binding protein [Anaerolineales bacterium]